jgi:6-phospho-3-hexuloisomerase
MQTSFAQAMELILAENQRVLQEIAYSAVKQLAQKIIGVERIFVIGEGRSGLAIRMAAMRLMHLGCQVYVVGETTTPSLRATDLFIACSGSGSTETVRAMTAKAKAIGAYIVCVPIELAAATKYDSENVQSQQFAGSLFEQSTLLFFDILFYVLSQMLNKNAQLLSSLHTNLE